MFENYMKNQYRFTEIFGIDKKVANDSPKKLKFPPNYIHPHTHLQSQK